MDDDLMYGLDNLQFVCDDCHKEIHSSQEEEYYFDREGNVCGKETKPKN